MWALFVIFGAVLRWWDGTRGDIGPVHVPGGVRSAMLAGACLLAAGWSFGFGIGTGIPWTGLWAAAGGMYPLLLWLHRTGRWQRWSPLDGPESWCRIPLGGFVIGGLAWL